MKLDSAFLRSKVAQRIFFLFVVCALLPIAILALVSFRSVSGELQGQIERQLSQLTKSQAMSIVERLGLLEVELLVAADSLARSQSNSPPGGFEPGPGERFLGLTLVSASGERLHLAGASIEPPSPSAEQQHLSSGQSLLVFRTQSGESARVFLGRSVDLQEPLRSTLWAEINGQYLWWGTALENTLPPAAELCILNASRTVEVFCPESASALKDELSSERRASLGGLTWARGDVEYLASYRTINLKVNFGFEGLTLVVSQEKDYLLGPLADFRKSFPPIILTSLLTVLLLSIHQIRKSLVPLERLQAGTQRIATRDFSTRVEIDSGDEFEQLAGAFNSMAERLGKQFGALRSMNSIVQGVLSALDKDEIVRSVLEHFDELLPCRVVSVTLLDDESENSARTYLRSPGSGDGTMASRAKVRSRELEPLHEHPDVLMLNSDSELPAYLQLFQENATGMVAIFPIFVDSRLVGMISAGFAPETTPGQEDLRQARQVTDQVAVAFSNAALLQQLEELTWGTLTALARTIDASSHWTSGHSERVATMAVRLGEAMRLSPRKLDLLHRGSLIHDIGKIGIPSQILDKPARLTGAEFEIVRTHVQLGARIVEPIAQLEGALPLILQHHEWFNGEGYPEGLAGEEINQMARILTVVDFYDAVRSPRPYRGPTSHEEVMTMVNEGVGVQFDPEVVDAFVKNKTWEARPTPEPLSRAAYG